MSQSLINTLYLALAFLVLFASAEVLYHRFKVKAELTRKYVHIVTGLLTLLFSPLIGNHWLVLILCSSFLVILLGSLYFNKLPSINAVGRVSRGSILYPIVVYGCYLLFQHYNQYIFYYIPILILAISDPVAALLGKRWPVGKYTVFGKSKTLVGSAGFFISALVITLGLTFTQENFPANQIWAMAIVVSIMTTLAEAVSHKGYDNLTIPAAAVLVLVMFNEYVFQV